jgi:dihydroorotase
VSPGWLAVGQPADLVVFDRGSRWTVDSDSLLTKGFGHPLGGRSLPGEVILTVASGRVAYEAASTE